MLNLSLDQMRHHNRLLLPDGHSQAMHRLDLRLSGSGKCQAETGELRRPGQESTQHQPALWFQDGHSHNTPRPDQELSLNGKSQAETGVSSRHGQESIQNHNQLWLTDGHSHNTSREASHLQTMVSMRNSTDQTKLQLQRINTTTSTDGHSHPHHPFPRETDQQKPTASQIPSTDQPTHQLLLRLWDGHIHLQTCQLFLSRVDQKRRLSTDQLTHQLLLKSLDGHSHLQMFHQRI